MIRVFITAIILSSHPLTAFSDIYKCVASGHVVYTDQPCTPGSRPTVKLENKPASSVSLEVNLTPIESDPYSSDDVGVAISSIRQIRTKMNVHLRAIRKAKSEEIGLPEVKVLLDKLKEIYPNSSKDQQEKLMDRYRAYSSVLDRYMNSDKIRKIRNQYEFTMKKWKLQLNFLRGTNSPPSYSFVDTPPYERIGKPGRMIFGGKDGDIYLGCIDCDENDIDHILNEKGDFGSCRMLKRNSLHCHGVTDEYGARSHASGLSACDDKSTYPPSIIDRYGKYYGRFSLLGDVSRMDTVCDIGLFGKLRDEELCNMVKMICK